MKGKPKRTTYPIRTRGFKEKKADLVEISL